MRTSTPTRPVVERAVLDLRSEAGIRHAWLAHSGELRAYALRRLRDRGRAEDALQETFLRAWRFADRFDADRGTVRAWLYAIMRNLLADMARANGSRPRTTHLAFDVPGVAQDIDAMLASLTLSVALQALRAEHREVLVQGYLRERSYAEIAQSLEVPLGTVRSRMFHARAALMSALQRTDAVEHRRPAGCPAE